MSEATEIASMGITTMIELMQARDEIKRLKEALAKQEQGEPVACAWMHKGEMVNAFPWPSGDPKRWDHDGYWAQKGYTREPLYTTPQQRKPLTDEQIDEIIQHHVDPVATYKKLHNFARAIEAAHGIKE